MKVYMEIDKINMLYPLMTITREQIIISDQSQNHDDLQSAIQKFEYFSNCALCSGAICLKILPFDCLSCCVIFICFYDIWM